MALGREARLPPTTASARTGRSPRPHYPFAGPNQPEAAPLAPGAPHSGSSIIAPTAAQGSLGRRRRGLPCGSGSCSPSRPRRCCRGRRARIWREPRRPPQPARRLDKAASRDVPSREMGNAGSILARSVVSIPPHSSSIDIPSEERAFSWRPGGKKVFCHWGWEVSSQEMHTVIG